MKVTISHLSLEEGAPLLHNDAIKMLFVEYRFLGVPLEETETPFSLPKPQPYTQIAYNFTKGIERSILILKEDFCSEYLNSRVNYGNQFDSLEQI